MDEAIIEVGEADIRLEPGSHPYEAAHRAAIDADWQRRRADNSRLYDGETVLGTRWTVSDGRLSIACRKINYSTLLYWLSVPPSASGKAGDGAGGSGGGSGTVHFFANAVVTGSDGDLLLGRMAAHTYNAGKVYMPSGSIDLDDFHGGRASLEANMRREVIEETGLDLDDAEALPGYRVIAGGGLLAFYRVYRFDIATAELAMRARAWLARGGDDELSEILTVRPGETMPEMPNHVHRFMMSMRGETGR